MHRTRKRGFTITELVIVIAVISILAAVLIPTFASLIEKANLSSDIQAVRQMNMVLAAESAVEKPADFPAVCAILGDAGYDDQNGMRPVSENHRFLWHKGYNIIFLAKIVAAENEATVVSPEDIAGLSFDDYNHYKNSLGDTVFDLAYPNIGYRIIDVSGVSLNENTLALSVGETATLVATVTPDDATDKMVNWSSSNATVATVDENGVVTAVAPGLATITVTTVDGGKTAYCDVTVTESAGGGSSGGGSSGGDSSGGGSGTTPDGPSISPSELTLALGDTATLTIVGVPEGTEYSVTWKPSAAGIVTVNKSGKVTTKGPGTVTVTATVKTADGTVIGTPTCTVTVNATVTVTNAEELVDALTKGGNVTLGADIVLQTHIEISNETVLDLNGQTLKIDASALGNSGMDVNATLRVGNGRLEIVGTEGHGGIFMAPGGTLILDSITVDHQRGICLQNHGNLTIYGCTFTGKNQTINNGVANDGVVTPGTLYIENTEFNVTATDSAWPVIWNRQGSTVTFNNVTITGVLATDYYGAFLNEGNDPIGSPNITVTYLTHVERTDE